MNKIDPKIIHQAAKILHQGGVIAYPTEAVFGFGCDPFNEDAITRILLLKQRSIKKGFILIASEWSQLESLTAPIDPKAFARVKASWPGPVTWVFPARPNVPFWIRGQHTTVAVRITQHPIASALCKKFGKAIVSTSANTEGSPPLRDAKVLKMTFGDKVDFIIPGKVGTSHRPTMIKDAISGEILRE